MTSIRIAAFALLAVTTTSTAAYGQAALPPVPAPPRADANGDGRVTLAEYQASRRTYLMKADKDRNGTITKAEWDREAKNLRNALELNGVEGADLIGRGSWWDAIDTEKSGVVTPAKIDAMTAQRFARYDTNKDGYIAKTEAETVRKAAQAQIR